MNAHFPIIQTLSQDANWIVAALNKRSLELKKIIDTQSLLKRMAILSFKILGLAATILTAASLTVAAFTFTAAPLVVTGGSVALAIACLALWILLDPRSPGESIVKEHWKALFEALRKGEGTEIIKKCKELAEQQESRSAAFAHCLGPLTHAQIKPFFHKTCLIGYLLIALGHLTHGNEEQVKSHAYLALSHYEASGFSAEVEQFAKALIDSSKEVREMVEKEGLTNDLHSMDQILVLRRASLAG